MSKQLIINGSQVDLGNEAIVTSYQMTDVQDLTTRRFNYSNRFKVPATPSNIKTFGFANKINSNTSVPYVKLPAKLIDNGIEVMPGAQATIVSTVGGFSIELYAGARTFFDRLGDKTLEDLETVNADDDLYGGNEANSMLRYAYIPNDETLETQTPLLPDEQRLTVNYKKLIERIIAANGYSVSGDVFNESKLAKLYMYPVGNKGAYNASFKVGKEHDVYYDGAPLVLGAAYQTLVFTDIIKQGFYNELTGENVAEDPLGGAYGGTWYTFKAFAFLDIATTGPVDIRLSDTSGGNYDLPGESTGIKQLELSDRTLAGNLSGIEGTVTRVRVRAAGGIGTPTLTINSGRFWSEVTDQKLVYLNAKGLMPVNVKQVDIMKDFAVRFGVLFYETNGVLECKMLKEILIDTANAKDWTDKRDHGVVEQLKFEFNGRYAQSNLFKYQSEDPSTSEATGQGDLAIANTNLEPKKDFYMSMFTSSITKKFGNETAGYITCAVVSPGDEAALRLLMLRNKRAHEPNLTGAVSSYYVPYFLDSEESEDCSFQGFLDDFYSELSVALQLFKLVDRRYKLSRIDINTLDLFLLIYDQGHYYLVNKISNYQSGRGVSVQLFKII